MLIFIKISVVLIFFNVLSFINHDYFKKMYINYTLFVITTLSKQGIAYIRLLNCVILIRFNSRFHEV